MARQLSNVERRLVDRIVNWAAPYHPTLAIFAFEAAHVAPAITAGLEYAANREILDGVVADHDEDRFFAYYESKGELISDACNSTDSENAPTAASVDQFIRILPKLVGRTVRESIRTQPREQLHRKYMQRQRIATKAVKRAARALVLGPDAKDLVSDEAAAWMSESLPMGYLLRIGAPYWIHYGMWPSDAFRLASNPEKPNMVRLKELVSIDPRIIHHPRLRPILHPANPRVEAWRLQEVHKAAGNPVKPLSSSVVKRRIAAMISEASTLLQVRRIKPTKINALFDLIAQCPHPLTGEKRLDALVDHELPVGDDLRSAIKHHGKRIVLAPKPDKNHFDRVRFVHQWFAYDPLHGRAA